MVVLNIPTDCYNFDSKLQIRLYFICYDMSMTTVNDIILLRMQEKNLIMQKLFMQIWTMATIFPYGNNISCNDIYGWHYILLQ